MGPGGPLGPIGPWGNSRKAEVQSQIMIDNLLFYHTNFINQKLGEDFTPWFFSAHNSENLNILHHLSRN